MPRHLKLTLAYDGTDFAGWQVQPDRVTIQGTLAEAIQRTTGEQVLPQGSGRTDAGVHALAQVASFAIESPIPLRGLQIALNDRLPATIRVMKVEEVGAEFHARHSAKAKTYDYHLWRAEICPPFLGRFVTHHPYPLDEAAMQKVARLFEGEHDFTSFAAVDPERGKDEEERSAVRTIFSSQWRRDGEMLIYRVRGSGFLHHMVRNLVGTMLLVGKGTFAPEDIPRILAARWRGASGQTAPASGLFLISVEY